jgi:hypothetical protein
LKCIEHVARLHAWLAIATGGIELGMEKLIVVIIVAMELVPPCNFIGDHAYTQLENS